jgi:hypothetical protein
MARRIEIFQVNVIARTPGGLLHLSQGVNRANGYLDTKDFGVDSGFAQVRIWRDSVEALDDVQEAKHGLDRNSLPGRDLSRNREWSAEKRLFFLDMAMSFNSDLPESLEILGTRRNDDVHILRSSDDPPGVYRKATHQNELHARLRESAQELIESGFSQWRRAEPTNCISL